MKREIKFRAWNSDLKEMLYMDNSEMWDTNWLDTGDLVMQFIGVLHRDIGKYHKGIFDKNGMEMPRIPVYEGDIVEFKSDPSFYINAKVGDRYIIEYYGAGFFMKPISWGLKKIDAQNYIGLLHPYQTSNMSNHYEVIGNIHQNPELL